jgi:hypothetical protein
VLWALFWLVLGLGISRLTEITGWLTLILSFTTCTIPGFVRRPAGRLDRLQNSISAGRPMENRRATIRRKKSRSQARSPNVACGPPLWMLLKPNHRARFWDATCRSRPSIAKWWNWCRTESKYLPPRHKDTKEDSGDPQSAPIPPIKFQESANSADNCLLVFLGVFVPWW